MDLDQFYEKFKDFKNRDQITIQCDETGCEKIEILNKDSAIRNINQNGHFICRSCSYTEEGLKKIAKATSYPRSAETKAKMSEAKKAFYETPEGEAFKKRLSQLTAKGHTENKYENTKRQGWFPSKKMGNWIFYGSSYELRLCSMLELDDSVLAYETQIGYTINDRNRCLDFLITYKNNQKKAIEVKPAKRLNEEPFILQLGDSEAYAKSKGWKFEIYTEEQLGMKCEELRIWADELRTQITGINYTKHRLEMNRKKAKKYYDLKIATDTVDVYCEYCKKTHTALKLTFDRNIKRNGRYICEAEGGFIAGSKPKKKKENPYASEGKKHCIGCDKIQLFTEFSLDKSRSDGYATKCKTCRADSARKKYNE